MIQFKMTKKHWPFKVVSGQEQNPMIYVGGSIFTPEKISSFVLAEMKKVAEKFLGQEVREAVITVPAYFNDSQRQATEVAGQLAGLRVLKIINEPTAAALAHGMERSARDNHETNILVFDLGGGTFDVCILSLNGNNFEVNFSYPPLCIFYFLHLT